MNFVVKEVKQNPMLNQGFFYHYGLMQEFFNFIYNQNVQSK